ncbi:MAG TPA: hypothetical protein VLV83_09790 [Acidobacteriota bacterium]|nr:hypothetical protein [Acidobacteriota bacterium]
MKKGLLVPLAVTVCALAICLVLVGRHAAPDRSVLGFEVPPYPPLALLFRVEGKVEVEFVLSNGVIRDVLLISADLSEPTPPAGIADKAISAEVALRYGRGNIIASLKDFYQGRKNPLVSGKGNHRVTFEYQIDSDLPRRSHSYFIEYDLFFMKRVVISACAAEWVACSDSE